MTTANLIAGLQILQKHTGGPEWHGFAANDGKVVACCDGGDRRANMSIRPYTPREAVEHLGRAMIYTIYTKYPKGKYKLIEVGLTHALIAGDHGYCTYEDLAKHYVWADTGEPCGVCREAD